MADTHWYMFDEAHDRVSTLTSDLENVRNILSKEELFDDEGNFTEGGVGTLATYVQELGVFEGALANAKDEMDLFGDSYDSTKTYVDLYGNDLSIDSEQDWYEAAKKAEETYDEWNNKVIETRYNIKDLYEQQISAVEEYTQTLVESYGDYIDSVKEALDAERDLYDFKRKIEDQSKSVAETERKIAALSGSTNAADIAERRRLEATLYDQKRDLDDSYRDHSQQSTDTALDNEMAAYETAMNAYIEGLRTKLEESTADLYKSYEEMGTETQSFVDGVTQGVILNAGNVAEAYALTGETIDQSLVTPWINAKTTIGEFASSEGALGIMSSWTNSETGSPFYDFQTEATKLLNKPWDDVLGAVGTFETTVSSTMTEVVSDVNQNVSNVISHLQTEIDKIKDTDIRINVEYETNGDASGAGGAKVVVQSNGGSTGMGYEITMNAKGTLGTKKDGFAVTDESWIGEEITLAAGKNGQLQYLKKGSSVMPADISANLVEWGKINPNMMNLGATPNINMITNAINKPEIVIDVENFLKVDRVDKDTLPQLEAMMDKKIDTFAKQLNYSIKKFTR
jgi:predicted HicB family RNase H-like nuclease